MRETWYVLEDGTFGDPADVAPDQTGALRHKNGTSVAMRGDVPSTSGVDADEERAKVSKPAPAKADAPAQDPVGARVTRPAKNYKAR